MEAESVCNYSTSYSLLMQMFACLSQPEIVLLSIYKILIHGCFILLMKRIDSFLLKLELSESV